jgi:hypothetical protein
VLNAKIEGRYVTLTATHPHNNRVGSIVRVAGHMHTVVEVKNKLTVVLWRWPWYYPSWLRVKAAWRLLFGKSRLGVGKAPAKG